MRAGGDLHRLLGSLVLVLALAGCGSGVRHQVHYRARPHPIYKIGPPYEINGQWYYPAVDYDYDRTGTASWYGAQFNEKYTANGEIFDLNGLTAAHKTLPLPSVVRVTNLQNGRALELRVNDRGPFVDGRIIDVSRRAAQLLGFETEGTAPVRVQVLRNESIEAAAQLLRQNGQPLTLLAAAVPPPAASAALPPPPAPLPTPGPAPAPMRRPAERIFVQAGAFSHRENAQRALRGVAVLGSAEVVHTAIGGIDFYRVRLGPFASFVAADRLLARIHDSGFPQARIVVD